MLFRKTRHRRPMVSDKRWEYTISFSSVKTGSRTKLLLVGLEQNVHSIVPNSLYANIDGTPGRPCPGLYLASKPSISGHRRQSSMNAPRASTRHNARYNNAPEET